MAVAYRDLPKVGDVLTLVSDQKETVRFVGKPWWGGNGVYVDVRTDKTLWTYKIEEPQCYEVCLERCLGPCGV